METLLGKLFGVAFLLLVVGQLWLYYLAFKHLGFSKALVFVLIVIGPFIWGVNKLWEKDNQYDTRRPTLIVLSGISSLVLLTILHSYI